MFQVQFSSRTCYSGGGGGGGGQKCLSSDWALIGPVFARISSTLRHLFHPTTPTLCNTNTALCSQSLYKTKRKKQNFCKIVMFMLYEIFIWNCFAKLLYFCMNVFFIGIIRNSYLTLACLVCLLDSFCFLIVETWFCSLFQEKITFSSTRDTIILTRSAAMWFILTAFLKQWDCLLQKEAPGASSCLINSIIKIPSKVQITLVRRNLSLTTETRFFLK